MALFDFLGAQQTGNQTVTQSIDPQIKQAYLDNVSFANTVASRPYEQYSGPRVAGFTGDQNQAFQQARDLQNQYQPYLNQATSALQSSMNFNPATVGYNQGDASMFGGASVNRGNIRDINAGSFLTGNVGSYMNPYTTEVIDVAMRDNERARQLAQQQVNAQAASRGAYGGSRQAIAEAENRRNFLDTQARTSAQLRNQGFDTAANLMQADFGRSMQAQQANQGIDASVAGQNAGFAQQAGIGNQAAQNQFALQNAQGNLAAQQFNSQQGLAGAQNRMQAANQFANLGAQGQQLGINATNFLGGFGAQQQAQTQRNYDLANQDFQNQFNYPLQQLAIRQSALGTNIPNLGGSTSQPTYTNPLGNLLGAGLGIKELFGL